MNTSLASFPTLLVGALPALAVAEMGEAYGMLPSQTLENAGRNLADLAQAWLGGQVCARAVLVLAGRGHNGAAGLAATRHLANRGADVQVVTPHALDDFVGAAAQQLHVLLAMGVSVTSAGDGWELPSADLVLDALIGSGLVGAPTGAVADLIRLANSHPAPILALDVPAGLDAATGVAANPSIQAAATLMLALPKRGVLAAPATLVGALFLADVGAPPGWMEAPDAAPLFARAPILRLV